METRLQEMLAKEGEKDLNQLRDSAAEVAQKLGLEKELEQLHALIGALLGTSEAPLSTDGARAAAAGSGWDDRRLPLFDALMGALHAGVLTRRSERKEHTGSTFAFYEAYFSNFIEGTEFTVEEAEAIVFNGAIPVERPADAHDVIGTFELVNDASFRGRVPQDADDLESVIKELHSRIMSGRPETRPGIYKEKANRVGSTEFVAPTLVKGTLRKGWSQYVTLKPGIQRAIFALFLIAEVHPFADGNGRVARALANAELTVAGQQRVIIPTVLRDDYLQGLRALSREAHPEPLIRVVDRAHQWVQEVDWSSSGAARADLERTNALLTGSEAEDLGVVLRLPSDLSLRPAGVRPHA